MDIDPLLLPADKPKLDLLFGGFSGEKKAALENVSQKCEIPLFSFKSIKWAGRWGRLYEHLSKAIHYAKISYATTPEYKKNQELVCMD
jgi:hypothetical protein